MEALEEEEEDRDREDAICGGISKVMTFAKSWEERGGSSRECWVDLCRWRWEGSDGSFLACTSVSLLPLYQIFSNDPTATRITH